MDWAQKALQNREETGIRNVSEISRIISNLLDDPRLLDIWVEGEVRDWNRSARGHCYFSLSEQRDGATYVINCVMWENIARELAFNPANGTHVLTWGSVGVYEPHGKYQFYVREMHEAGAGEKHILVQRWKEQLQAEGLFATERKRPLPLFPRRVGVVTSATGAARRDIENVIGRRFPVEIILSPSSVQGDNAHTEIAAAIRAVGERADVIIVGRGGGSFEDLFAFNHPEVIRAIGACPVPVVSAVGHEIDFTLADLAADLRAPTPSAAAELVVPDRQEIRQLLSRSREQLDGALESRVIRSRQVLEEMRLWIQPRRIRRRIDESRQRLAELEERLSRDFRSYLEREQLKLAGFAARVEGGNPYTPLSRGYCFVQKGDRVVSSIGMLKKGDRITLRMTDGKGTARMEEICHGKDL